MKHQAGWNTSCNQDCQEKYQQSQISRWHHPNGSFWETHINMRSLSISPVQFSHSACLTLWPHGQASLSITNFWSLLKLMSIELVMPSNHLVLFVPFSSCLQPFPVSGSFPMSWLFASGCQSIGASVLVSVLPMHIQGWFPFRLIGVIFLPPKRLSKVNYSTSIWKHLFFGAQPSLWSNCQICTWLQKNHSF